jgi:hypothetical protein
MQPPPGDWGPGRVQVDVLDPPAGTRGGPEWPGWVHPPPGPVQVNRPPDIARHRGREGHIHANHQIDGDPDPPQPRGRRQRPPAAAGVPDQGYRAGEQPGRPLPGQMVTGPPVADAPEVLGPHPGRPEPVAQPPEPGREDCPVPPQ